MLKQIYEINANGHLQKIHVKEFDEQGNCTEEFTEDIITVDPPQGLYRAKWTGTEWVETMTEQEYIATLPIQTSELTEEQQRIADLELAIAEILGGGI